MPQLDRPITAPRSKELACGAETDGIYPSLVGEPCRQTWLTRIQLPEGPIAIQSPATNAGLCCLRRAKVHFPEQVFGEWRISCTELRPRLRDHTFTDRPSRFVALAGNSLGQNGHRDCKGRQQHDEGGRDARDTLVLPHGGSQHVPGAVTFGVDGIAYQVPLDVLPQSIRRLIATLAFLGKGLEHDGVHLVADARAVRGRPDRLHFGDVADDVRQGAGNRIGQIAREHLEKDDAQRVYVTARVHLVGIALDLLRRCVGHGAHELAGLRGHDSVGRPLSQCLGQTEIQHARLAVGIDEDVAGLEVAMNDPPLMGVLHRRTDPREQPEDEPARIA